MVLREGLRRQLSEPPHSRDAGAESVLFGWDALRCPPPGPGCRQAQPLRFTAQGSGGSIPESAWAPTPGWMRAHTSPQWGAWGDRGAGTATSQTQQFLPWS